MARIETADGLRLHAEAHGEGPPLLISCGLCTTCENFRPQVEPLRAAGFRVVLWDYRGHGRSDAPHDPGAYSLARVLDDMQRVLAWAAPGAPAILAGHSFGGLASLHYAHRHPERVRALLLFGSGPGFKNPDAQRRWQEQCDRTASYLEERGLRAFIESKAGVTAVGLRPELPAARAAGDAIAAQDPVALGHFSRLVAGPAPGAIELLAEIAAPTLVLVGELDQPYLRAAEMMAARLPRATRVVLPGAGHIANLEAGPAFDAAVLAFLRDLPPDAGNAAAP